MSPYITRDANFLNVRFTYQLNQKGNISGRVKPWLMLSDTYREIVLRLDTRGLV